MHAEVGGHVGRNSIVSRYSTVVPLDSALGAFGLERGNSCCLRSSPILALAPT